MPAQRLTVPSPWPRARREQDGGLRSFYLPGKGSIAIPFTSQSIGGEVTAAYRPSSGATLYLAAHTPFAAAAVQLAYHQSSLKVNYLKMDFNLPSVDIKWGRKCWCLRVCVWRKCWEKCLCARTFQTEP